MNPWNVAAQIPLSSTISKVGSNLCPLSWLCYLTISSSVAPSPLQVSSVQSLSCVQLFATPWTVACQASLSITNSWTPLKLMSIELVMPSNHRILCRALLLLPSISPSIRVFSNELLLCIRWPKYWSFSFSISPSNEYSGLISFRMGWLDLLVVQGTLKSLLWHHSSKALILWCSAFFIESYIPLSSCLPSFPASVSFPESWVFTSGGQNIGVSAWASVLSRNIQHWFFPSELTGLLSLQSKKLSTVFSSTTIKKHQLFDIQVSLWSNSHIHTWQLEKTQLWLMDLCWQNNISIIHMFDWMNEGVPMVKPKMLYSQGFSIIKLLIAT